VTRWFVTAAALGVLALAIGLAFVEGPLGSALWAFATILDFPLCVWAGFLWSEQRR
jgi:hypothetical protein